MAFTPIKFDGRKSANVAEIDTNFQNVANEISNIESEISILPALQNDITNNKNDIFSLQSNLSIANTDIDNLQNSVSVIPTIQQDVISIYSTLGDLSVPEDILANSDIGVTVQGYSANLTDFLNTFTLPDTDGSAGYVLATDGDGNLELVQPSGGGGTGTVTSVGLSLPTGLEVSGSPITTTGTFTVTYATGYSIPTTAKQSQWDTAYSWGNHADAGYLTSVSWGDIDGAPTIPTKVSDLTNDAGYLTSVSWSIVTDKPTIPEKVSDLINDSGFISVESDPVFSISAAAGISSGDVVNWNTAYSWGNHADAGYLTDDDIDVTVQGYDAATAKTDEVNTWLELQTFKSTKDTIYTITDGPTVDINPANGGIQIWALGDNRTPTATNFENGQSVTLMIDDGSAYTITWAIVDKWFGGAPTLSTDELTGIVLFKAGGVMYGTTLPEVAA